MERGEGEGERGRGRGCRWRGESWGEGERGQGREGERGEVGRGREGRGHTMKSELSESKEEGARRCCWVVGCVCGVCERRLTAFDNDACFIMVPYESLFHPW